MEMASSIEQPEPAFRAPELHGRPGETEADLAWLEMHLARQPRDLAGHSRRVQLARHSGNREAVYGALVDLFIALAGHGVGLKSALLSQSALLLGPPERIRDRLQAWKAVAKEGKLGTLVLTGATPEALRVVAEAVL